MKKRSYVLLIFLIFFVLFIAVIFSFFYIEFAKPPEVKAHSFLEISLSGEIQEKAAPNLFDTLLYRRTPLSMYDIWMNFQKAKKDQRIDAVVLRLGYLFCNWAKVSEIRDLVLDFRESGKKVYAYIGETIEFDKEYFLATACDKIILHPEGILVINGIGGDIPFVKKALDKIGIEAEVEHAEEYKTAYHMFIKDKLTPAHREMLHSLYQSLFLEYIKGISEKRNIDQETVKKLIDQALFRGAKAKEVGLVDDLLYEDQFEEMLINNNRKMHRIPHEQYLKTKPSSLGLNRGKKIALIYGMGPIVSGSGLYNMMGSQTISRWLETARKDKSIAAVIFRVDSPGGSVVASDSIWREVSLTKKEKPVIVSMSDMAGSGGYQVSMAAHKIVAQPQTLTGSIGVIFAKVNLKNLYEKLGISSEKILYGKRADMFSTFRRFTQKERQLLKKEIRDTYERFITKVANERHLTRDEVDRIGRGRVWTGMQAKELGLIDETGGLSRAIELAKELAQIPANEPIRLLVWPKKVSLFQVLFGRRSAKSSFDLSPKMEAILTTLRLLENDLSLALMPFWIKTD